MRGTPSSYYINISKTFQNEKNACLRFPAVFRLRARFLLAILLHHDALLVLGVLDWDGIHVLLNSLIYNLNLPTFINYA